MSKLHIRNCVLFVLTICFLQCDALKCCGQTPVSVPYYHALQTYSRTFQGPDTSEQATPNPFTDYRLLVTFTRSEKGKIVETKVIRGHYAADGDAAETGADSGNRWRVRFTPERSGRWDYKAELRRGKLIAIDEDPNAGEVVKLNSDSGVFSAGTDFETSAHGDRIDFRNRGRIVIDGTYFRFMNNGKLGERWLKAGADSPENLLAYIDFDGTYRTSDKARDGESKPSDSLHRFPTHTKDWTEDDPTWRDGKGKSLIGAVNYLSSTGMNACYFLTNNIKGDGHDVWPYTAHDEFTRFDCSKLDQWEIVFNHMQSKGILLHVVTQETENEKMLDDGDTGTMRKLYYRELISRFAHHPALVWNLGEENGPADFSPNGQNAEQQKAMSDYLKQNDPYKHPVIIHTHSTAKGKTHVLDPLVGHESLDGLSFQVDNPKRVHKELIEWKKKAVVSGRPWIITMDEIGKWDTGVLPDSEDPDHDGLRYRVLWGSLMAGGAGVEWYFGAKQQHNDLNCEDWRQHENMWLQSKIAIDFFDNHLPYWDMKPADERVVGNGFCFEKPGEVFAFYLPAIEPNPESDLKVKLPGGRAKLSVRWFDPKKGGDLLVGSKTEIPVNQMRYVKEYHLEEIGAPPKTESDAPRDWVVLLKPE